MTRAILFVVLALSATSPAAQDASVRADPDAVVRGRATRIVRPPEGGSETRTLTVVARPVLLSLAIAPVAAQPDVPTEMTFDAGFDSHGQRWSFVGRNKGRPEPILVKGPRTFAIAGTDALSYMSLMGTIDRQDRLWIVDTVGEGVEIDLSAATGRRFTILVKENLERGLEFHDGALHVVERVLVRGSGNAADQSFALTRYDPGSGRKVALYVPGNVEGASPRLAIAGRLAWFVNAVHDAQGRHACEVAGIDLDTRAAVVTDRRNGHSDHVHYDEVAGAPDGSVWLAGSNPRVRRVSRRDPSGTWREWSFEPQAPARISGPGLVFSSGHALVVLRQFPPEPQASSRSAPRSPGSPQMPISVELAAIGADTGEVRRLPLPPSNDTLRLDQTGWAWLGNHRVLVTPDRLEIADVKGER